MIQKTQLCILTISYKTWNKSIQNASYFKEHIKTEPQITTSLIQSTVSLKYRKRKKIKNEYQT